MRKMIALVLGIISLAGAAAAEDVRPLTPETAVRVESMASIPVLDNGRLKPLDSYARGVLLQFSGKDTYMRKPALVWLAALLFAPESTQDDKVFLINNPDIPVALGIEPVHTRRYSFKQIRDNYTKFLELAEAAAKIKEKDRSLVEAEVIRVFDNLQLYAGLSREMVFAAPLDDFQITSAPLKKRLSLPAGGSPFTFLDIALRAESLRAMLDEMKQKDKSRWSTDEDQAMHVLSRLFQLAQEYKDLTFAVVPDSRELGVWLAPWDSISQDFREEVTRQYLMHWQDMRTAYWKGDQRALDAAARAYVAEIPQRLSKEDARKVRTFPVELTYNTWHPFLIAKICYILSLMCFVASFMTAARAWYGLAWAFILGGFVPHVLALVARIVIMGRPPVSSLYETFIFVSLIAVLLGLIIERINGPSRKGAGKPWLGLVVAGVSGTALLFIAGKYSAEGDTLKVLVAVLNSNFWLATHVTTITMGYASTCVAGLLGHIWLIQAAARKEKAVLDNTYRVMMGMLGLALTLTFFGTNLGGIWADQSWGRFWGWDPKENGALMIVLWSAMLFHARVANIVGQKGMAVGTSIGMMVVVWAWFGVNLLSVGLHSYGFTSGLANALYGYAAGEVLFLAAVALAISSRPSA